jgi:hypothetical protein
MKPVITKATNHDFGPPEGKEGVIGSLPCEIRDTTLGVIIYATYELEDWERKAIAEGQNIELGVGWIGVFPPVSLGVTPAKEITPDDFNEGEI